MQIVNFKGIVKNVSSYSCFCEVFSRVVSTRKGYFHSLKHPGGLSYSPPHHHGYFAFQCLEIARLILSSKDHFWSWCKVVHVFQYIYIWKLLNVYSFCCASFTLVHGLSHLLISAICILLYCWWILQSMDRSIDHSTVAVIVNIIRGYILCMNTPPQTPPNIPTNIWKVHLLHVDRTQKDILYKRKL